MYFMARHTAIDCFDKRGRRGYLFLIGDELPYPKVSAAQVRDVIGDDLGEDISTETILAELQRRYHVYYIIPAGSSYARDERILDHWRNLAGAERHPARRPGGGVRDDRAHDRAGGGGDRARTRDSTTCSTSAPAPAPRSGGRSPRSATAHGTVVRGPSLRSGASGSPGASGGSGGSGDDGLIRL
jgi:hypothetical protein